jgi:hypothetical protein
MGGMEFTWKMVSALVWPLVVIVLGVVFRRALVAGFQTLTAGLRSFKAAGVELGFAMDNAWQDVTDVLAGMPGQVTEPGEVPTNLVDLYPLAAKNPRRAVREAFRHVRQALAQRFPATAGVSQENLAATMDSLVARNAMSGEVEQAVGQVARVLGMIDLIGDPDEARRQALEYIGLAEGAIHVILRAGGGRSEAEPDGEPGITGRWTGSYVSSKGPMEIELLIDDIKAGRVAGEMFYPDGHGARTRITGQVVTPDRPGFTEVNGFPRLEWQERGNHADGLDFDGVYRAVILGDRLFGDWRKDGRLVGMIQLARDAKQQQ